MTWGPGPGGRCVLPAPSSGELRTVASALPSVRDDTPGRRLFPITGRSPEASRHAQPHVLEITLRARPRDDFSWLTLPRGRGAEPAACSRSVLGVRRPGVSPASLAPTSEENGSFQLPDGSLAGPEAHAASPGAGWLLSPRCARRGGMRPASARCGWQNPDGAPRVCRSLGGPGLEVLFPWLAEGRLPQRRPHYGPQTP